MKLRYVAGFFLFTIVCISILDLCFFKSYQISKNEAITEQNLETKEPNVPADGQAQKSEGYYLNSSDGYVIVYLSDKKTVFQYTNIQIQVLPDDISNEIQNGKWIFGVKELYSFLENYSS